MSTKELLDKNKNNEDKAQENIKKETDKIKTKEELKKVHFKKNKINSEEKKTLKQKQINEKKETKKRILAIKERKKEQIKLTKLNSKNILNGEIVSLKKNSIDTAENIIELFDVKKSYVIGEIETLVLDNINLKINKGKFNVILGPSGSGKTTLLNLISGLDKATDGDVFVVGHNLTLLKDSHLTKFRREHIGFIFQQYNLLTNLTAKENAEVGENLSKRKNVDWTIDKIFETIDMKDQMNKYPYQMSGGQQQRVSIARALAKKPTILFGDEPTGALDEKTGRKVLDILLKINKEFKTTIILVTHNPNIAKIADVVVHVLNGQIDKYIKNPNPISVEQIEWS